MNPASNTKHFAAAGLALLSVIYYALYITAGFNYADDGNYAQTAYELFLGQAPQDLELSYGLLWYQAGAVLFHIFGVHFLLVRLLFFTAITLTTILVFYSLVRVSGSILLAAVLSAVIAAAPAFPATAFYGLCVTLNAAAQLRLAMRFKDATLLDGALAGAAVGLSFQVRPDFGFVFAGSLAATIALLVWPVRRPVWRTVLSGAAAGFCAIVLPAALFAVTGGYGSILARQYLDYPLLVMRFVAGGLHSGSGEITLLARPGLAAPGLAALVYLPLAIFALFAACILTRITSLLRQDPGALAMLGIAMVAGVATFPHYFLYRPDLSHIANFMPGFVLMTGVMLGLLKRGVLRAPRPVAAASAALSILYLFLYAGIGIPSPATGSIGMAAGRTEPFIAENGVNVRVAPGELAQLVFLRDTVEANSKPGDAIVCVPYCPGVAFMTGRRMFLHNFYVDDTFLAIRPQWLPTAIAETRAARPPVAIVGDWAINGTERSRFANWAAAYVETLKEQARAVVTSPGTTIYLSDPLPR